MDIPTYRGRGPNVPEIVDKIIAEKYLKDPDQTAKEVMEGVHNILREKGLQLRPEWPGLSYIQKRLTRIREVSAERSPESKELDKAWNLGTLTKSDLPPESIPIILEIQEEMKRHNKKKHLTMRQAWWVSHLRYLVRTPKVLSMALVLSRWAATYASAEKIAEVTDTKLDTSDMDKIILVYPEEYAAYPFLFSLIQNNLGIDIAGRLVSYILELRCEGGRRELSNTEKRLIELANSYESDTKELTARNIEDFLEKLPEDQQFTNVLKEMLKEADHERSHSQKV